jgi:hypothetical protein
VYGCKKQILLIHFVDRLTNDLDGAPLILLEFNRRAFLILVIKLIYLEINQLLETFILRLYAYENESEKDDTISQRE